MNSIALKYFKAFADQEILLNIDGNNILICGENGSGKSSLYEAIKWVFFREKILSSRIPASTQEEARSGLVETIKAEYNNRSHNLPFDIKINDCDYTNFISNEYHVGMVNNDCLNLIDKIDVATLLTTANITIDNENQFMKDNRVFMIDYINYELDNRFKEHLKIHISEDYPYRCTINDNSRGLSADERLKNVFNEAKLHIVVTLILFSIIRLSSNIIHHKLIVVDDIFSSLDAANRLIYIQYLIDLINDDGFQLFIFTHNVSFFNLFEHTIKNIKQSEKWKSFHLYDTRECPKIYPYQNEKTIDDIETLINNPANGMSLDDIGNLCRKKFESLVHRFAELLMVGANEETKSLISALGKEYYYYYGPEANIYKLVDEIEGIIKQAPQHLMATKIKTKINSYRVKNESVKYILNSMVLYQKVILHPMSHISGEKINYTQKEISIILDSLRKLQESIHKISEHPDVTRM